MHTSKEALDTIMALVLLVAILIAVSSFIGWLRRLFRWTTVYSHERGLHFHDGKLMRVLEPGRYFMIQGRDTVVNIDTRQQVLNVVNQELICADNFSIRLSASVLYEISDPRLYHESSRNAYETLYLETQLCMRELVAGLKVEEIVSQRNELSSKLEEQIKPRAAAIGITLVRAGIRDVTFPADVKKAFTQVAQAEKAAQATLAKSRAETASLRALANAAKMIEGNPNLLALRSLHSISELATSTGNTIVLGVPSPMVPLGSSGKQAPQPEQAAEEE